jgi:coenzyme F420 hydrogenase subunit beta
LSFEILQREVVKKGLCVRCGLCAGVCPVKAIGFNDNSYPIPIGHCTECGLCTKVCPGADVDLEGLSERIFNEPYDPMSFLGHQEEMLVGYPTDETIRREGTSGGLATGLLVYLLKTGKIRGGAVVGMDPEKPWKTKSLLATTEEEMRSSAKSKYCIVPSMDVIGQMRKQEGPFAVVALPCQAHGLRKLESADPSLAGKIAYIIGLYCHYNLEKEGYVDVLRSCGIDPEDIARFEFRGGGWPGGFFAVMKNGKGKLLHSIPISDITTILMRLYGPERCFLCTDATCEFADISLGDFWAGSYEDYLGELGGSTLCSLRTRQGRELLESAERDGAVKLYHLPQERHSKRIIYYAMEKKLEGFIRMHRFIHQGRGIPNYHHEIPRVNLMARFAEAIRYRSTHIFRYHGIRRLLLKIVFSPFGQLVLAHISALRKNIFSRHHGN